MNPFDQLLQTLQGLLTSAGGLLNPGNPTAGLLQWLAAIGGAYTEAQKMDWLQGAQDLQKQSAQIGMDPTQLSHFINQLTKPMSNALITNTLNPVNAEIAQRGLATSPTMSQYISQQALAPYQLQEQQMGQQAAQFGLGLPFNLQWQYPTIAASGVFGLPPTTTTTNPPPVH